MGDSSACRHAFSTRPLAPGHLVWHSIAPDWAPKTFSKKLNVSICFLSGPPEFDPDLLILFITGLDDHPRHTIDQICVCVSIKPVLLVVGIFSTQDAKDHLCDLRFNPCQVRLNTEKFGKLRKLEF